MKHCIQKVNLSNGEKQTLSGEYTNRECAEIQLAQMFRRLKLNKARGIDITECALNDYYCYRLQGIEYMVKIQTTK